MGSHEAVTAAAIEDRYQHAVEEATTGYDPGYIWTAFLLMILLVIAGVWSLGPDSLDVGPTRPVCHVHVSPLPDNVSALLRGTTPGPLLLSMNSTADALARYGLSLACKYSVNYISAAAHRELQPFLGQLKQILRHSSGPTIVGDLDASGQHSSWFGRELKGCLDREVGRCGTPNLNSRSALFLARNVPEDLRGSFWWQTIVA